MRYLYWLDWSAIVRFVKEADYLLGPIGKRSAWWTFR